MAKSSRVARGEYNPIKIVKVIGAWICLEGCKFGRGGLENTAFRPVEAGSAR